MHLGWADSKKDYAALANVIERHDFVALQEVMNMKALYKLKDKLNEKGSWDVIASHAAIGTGKYKEFYAFLYRTDKVEYVGGANVYLDRDNVFAREPFSANFCDIATQRCFAAATIHLIYGKTVKRREAEAKELADYVNYVENHIAEAGPILLMGDFNLPFNSKGFIELRRAGFSPLFTGKTTLSKANGRYTSAYDNIWVNTKCASNLCGAPDHRYIDKFPDRLGMSHSRARSTVSDHALVGATW